MDVVSSIAAISQLIAQTIDIIQLISKAQKTVRGLPKVLSDHMKQLLSLRDTLRLVQDEDQLQTASVTSQLNNVHELAQELQASLQQAAQLSTRSSVKQYIHAMSSGKQYDEELRSIFDRLDSARSELRARILLALVSITGTHSDQLHANLSIIQRIDTNVQKVLGARLSIAEFLLSPDDIHDSQLPSQKLSHKDSLSLKDLDHKSLGLDTSSTSQDEVSYIGNMSFDQARMINGDIGAVMWMKAAKLEYRNNEARGNSLQVNGMMDLQSFSLLLEARK